MRLWSDSWSNGERIPPKYACGKLEGASATTFSDNCNPHLAWSDLPAAAKSLVLICHDFDVPSRGDDVNQAGREIPADLPRVDFFHWVLVELPPSVPAISAGEFSSAIVPHGKPGPDAPHGARHGINDYTSWFAGDGDMKGDYYGYDGPCPPWNDELPHRYVFTVYALDVARLSLPERFGGKDVRQAIEGHVLAQASITGRYSLNPAVKL
jgi:Raf kinase inhibitor-like YbhB/YbcL family protein